MIDPVNNPAHYRSHCLRWGINPRTANAYRRRGNRSDVATLDYYVNRMAA